MAVVLDGVVYYRESEYNAILSELLQRREEVAELMRRVEQAEEDEKRAVENADRLLNENIQLQQQLEEAREAKKVPLPREVAEALAKLQEQNRMWSPNAQHYNMIDSLIGVMRGTARANRPLATVTKWVADSYDRRDLIIKAVVNGYTVEERQTFQTNRKLDASEIRALRNWYKGALLRMEDGTDPDGFAKEAIEEVALYLGGAELLKDVSTFCKNQLERENAAKSG